MVVVGRLDQKMPGPIFCPSPALVGWISDMSEILVAPREGMAQLKQSYEPTALNSVLFPSLRLRGNITLTI